MNSNYTGRTHRNMQSAFGPYASRQISEPHQPLDRADKIVVVGCLCAAVFLIIWSLAS